MRIVRSFLLFFSVRAVSLAEQGHENLWCGGHGLAVEDQRRLHRGELEEALHGRSDLRILSFHGSFWQIFLTKSNGRGSWWRITSLLFAVLSI